MASTDTFKVDRYNFDKVYIASGKLTVVDEGQNTILVYKDIEIEEQASALYHPIAALEALRKLLETNHHSLIGINGCRIDTAYRFDGSFNSYIIEHGKKSIEEENLHMFEPTTEVEKLCTAEQHRVAYERWLESMMPKR